MGTCKHAPSGWCDDGTNCVIKGCKYVLPSKMETICDLCERCGPPSDGWHRYVIEKIEARRIKQEREIEQLRERVEELQQFHDCAASRYVLKVKKLNSALQGIVDWWNDGGTVLDLGKAMKVCIAALAGEPPPDKTVFLTECDGCKRAVPRNDIGEHYEHSAWIPDPRTPGYPRQTFKFTTCANWSPSPYGNK